MITDADVARWMWENIINNGLLYQDVAAYHILTEFGEQFVYVNANGNYSISKKVLAEFKRLTANNVVWERGERSWRVRQAYDSAGRQQE